MSFMDLKKMTVVSVRDCTSVSNLVRLTKKDQVGSGRQEGSTVHFKWKSDHFNRISLELQRLKSTHFN